MNNDDQDERIRALEAQVERLETENRNLRAATTRRVAVTTSRSSSEEEEEQEVSSAPAVSEHAAIESSSSPPLMLTKDEVERYSRQLLVTGGGTDSCASILGSVAGQCKLRQAHVVVVGAGGIGSTVLLYLAAAGVGTLRVVDFDRVEVSNLHRQIIHSTNTVGQSKAQSARQAVLALNPMMMDCQAVEMAVSVDNVLEILGPNCDCVVDASDNPSTRYLLNDACYFAQVPLVSGSAVGTEGQCTVYHYHDPQKDSCCYRCMYPPETQSSCQSCSDAGVLGPVPGLIGILQAMEVLKILTASKGENNNNTSSILHSHLLMYDAMDARFLRLKKPPRQPLCALCGNHPTITSLQDTRVSLEGVRGPASVHLPPPQPLDVSCHEYNQQQQPHQPHLLLDVRASTQFALCRLPHAVNLPLRDLPQRLEQIRIWTQHDYNYPIYCFCRRGNDSIRATQLLQEHGWTNVHNLREGLVAWRRDVDPSFPAY